MFRSYIEIRKDILNKAFLSCCRIIKKKLTYFYKFTTSHSLQSIKRERVKSSLSGSLPTPVQHIIIDFLFF